MATTQGIKLDEETCNRLKTLGEIRDRSPHWLMKAAIQRYLEEEERYEKERREDMARWERYNLTGKFVPHAAVSEWLDDLAQGKATPCPK